MLFGIKFEETEKPQPTLVIRTQTKIDNLPAIIGTSYEKIMTYMQALGAKPADVPFVGYFNMDMNNLDVEIGFPVDQIYPDKDDIKSSNIPSGKKVSGMYKGPYQEMEEPYQEMVQWVTDNHYEPLNISYEFYYNAPTEVPESELLTKIVFLLK
ncbi:MAG: GyrI-like domain-containing protein [Eubacteriaceae bacterium]